MFCNFCRILERAFMAGHEDVPFAVSFRDNSCNFWHSCYAWTRLSLHSKCSPPLFLTFASSNPIPRLPALALIPSPLLEGPLVYHSTLTMQQAVLSLSKNMTKLCTDTTENPCSKWGQSKSGDYQEVAWPWRLYCAAAIQHLRRVNFSKEGSSSTIASK